MEKISKKQFALGAFWKITENVAAKGVSFLVSLILARILVPGDYGIIAITTIFTNLSDLLIDGGFSTTLIRKKNVDKYDYSCVFMASLGIAMVLYALLFWAAPSISIYYDEPILSSVLRVIGLVLFIQAFSSTRNAVVHRNMQFKLLFYCNVIGSVVSGILGIGAALLGLGVWALVIQQLSQQFIVTILLFAKLHWKFSWDFRWDRFKEIFSFSVGVMGASLLNFAGSSIYNLFIGKHYSVTDLGYYDKGGQLPMQVSLYSFSAMSSVLLPTLSSYQDDIMAFKKVLRKVVGATSYLLFPMMIGMAVVSEELVIVLLTDKWISAIRIMQYMCIYYIATPFMLINIQVFYALGHGFLRMKTEIVRLILLAFGLAFFGFIFKFSINKLALVNALIAVIIALLTYYEVVKLIDYRISDVIKDVGKPLITSIIMGMLVFIINETLKKIGFNFNIARLILDVICGGAIYWMFSKFFKIKEYQEILTFIKRRKS